MNRSELARQLAGRTGLGAAESDAAVKAVLSAVAGALARGEPVRLAGFGTFEAKGRPARKGRNPQTGAAIAVPASKAVKFRAAGAFRDAVNGPPGPGSRP